MFLFKVGAGPPLVTQPAGRAVDVHFISVAADAASVHFESDQPARHALLFLLHQRVAAHEIALVELHDPGQIGFPRRDGRVDLMPVERHFRFKTQRVARAQARRFYAEFLARREDLIPDPRGFVGRDVDLEAVLAGVAGARDARRSAGNYRRR